MIFFTGDTHGQGDKLLRHIRRFDLGAEDVIVILGDAGFNYYRDGRDIPFKRQINDTGVTAFCIHGNHEQRPYALKAYHEVNWRGGVAYVEDAFPNLLFARDGEVYDLDGRQAIAIGGAYSVDKNLRLMAGANWFENEQPDATIRSRVEAVLEQRGWSADVVLSHTCPEKYIPFDALIPGTDQRTVDRSTEKWLDSIENKLSYTKWLCGHWHIDRAVDKVRFLMEDFVAL